MRWPTWREVMPSLAVAAFFLGGLYWVFRSASASAAAEALAPVYEELANLKEAVVTNGTVMAGVDEQLWETNSRLGSIQGHLEALREASNQTP